MAKKVEEVEAETLRYTVSDVPVQRKPMIVDNDNEVVYEHPELVWSQILNEIHDIKKFLMDAAKK